MDKKKSKEFREKLLTKQAELTQGYTRSKTAATETNATGSEDFVDYAVSAYTKEFLLSLSDRDRRTLVLVDDALVRLRKGTFGTCQECAKPIGEKRLQAVPWTPFCLSCQERVEREESRSMMAPTRPLLE